MGVLLIRRTVSAGGSANSVSAHGAHDLANATEWVTRARKLTGSEHRCCGTGALLLLSCIPGDIHTLACCAARRCRRSYLGSLSSPHIDRRHLSWMPTPSTYTIRLGRQCVISMQQPSADLVAFAHGNLKGKAVSIVAKVWRWRTHLLAIDAKRPQRSSNGVACAYNKT